MIIIICCESGIHDAEMKTYHLRWSHIQMHRLILAQNWAQAATYTVVYVWRFLEVPKPSLLWKSCCVPAS